MTAPDRIREALGVAVTNEVIGAEIGGLNHSFDEIADHLAPLLVPALEAHASDAVAEALREGMRDCPAPLPALTERVRFDVENIRAENHEAGLSWNDKNATEAIDYLLAIIDHQAARIASLANDSDQWQDGKRAGWAECREAATMAAMAVARSWDETHYDEQLGHKAAVSVAQAIRSLTVP